MTTKQEGLFTDCERSLASADLHKLEALRGGKILLTGASGFVGTWVATMIAYLNDRHGFGIRLTGVARQPSRLNDQAEFLTRRVDIRYVRADVRQVSDIDVDTGWIIHAAANPDARHHATNPIDTAAVIGEGTLHMLRTADRLAELRAFLHLSSGLVVGHVGHDAGEGYSVGDAYVTAKAYSEALCAAFRNQARLPITVSRPFTFIGPFQSLDAPWAVNNFLHAALTGQPIKILGSGDVTRSYLYGSDMAVLLLLQLASGRTGSVHDLGGLVPVSLRELAMAVVRQVRRPIEIRYNTAGKEAAERALMPVKPMDAPFGFVPAFDLEAAIARTLHWHEAESA